MVYIRSWAAFHTEALAMYDLDPKTRYVLKFSPTKGQVIVKVTNNVLSVKYKSRSSALLNRIESLDLSLASLMQNRQLVPQQDPAHHAAQDAVHTQQADGAKSKKNKKKKK